MSTTSTTGKNTNVFYNLYSTTNDVTSSGFVCGKAIDETDTSFDISGTNAVISDSNGDKLSTLDLSGIHADGITEYYTETKILQPYSAYLLHGNITGDTYASQSFMIDSEITSVTGYESYINIVFDIHYTSCGNIYAINIDTYKMRTAPGSVIDIIQAKLDSLSIPVSVSIKQLDTCSCGDEPCLRTQADYLVFQSSSEGYSFYVHTVKVSAVDVDYENYDGSWVDYTESPFIGAYIDFDYIIDLIRDNKPRYNDGTTPNYTNIPCDIYKYFISIAPLAITDITSFRKNVSCINRFAECFDDNGIIIESKQAIYTLLKTTYPEIYEYYFGNQYGILNKYNIHDIIKMLNIISNYIYNSNVSGPYILDEDISKRIYNQKYENGAFRGMVLVPDWSSSSDGFSVLKLSHVSDYINMFEKVQISKNLKIEGISKEYSYVYIKRRAEVKINTLLQSEYDIYNRNECSCNIPIKKITSNDTLATCETDNIWTYNSSTTNTDSIWSDSTSSTSDSSLYSDYIYPHKKHLYDTNTNKSADVINEYITPEKYDFMKNVPGHSNDMRNVDYMTTVGLYGYMNYLNENDLWQRVGEGYMIVGAKDDYQSKIKNYQSSVLIYNPNDIPVRIKFMVFS
jgi:hypothetical protein